MAKQSVTVEVDVPDGYRVIACREARTGDTTISRDGRGVVTWNEDSTSGYKYFILQQIEEPKQ